MNKDYINYISKNLDKTISYSEYISDNLDKTISFSEYISEQIDYTNESRSLLVSIMMAKYGLTDSDLKSIDIVKSKLRDTKIDEIIK